MSNGEWRGKDYRGQNPYGIVWIVSSVNDLTWICVTLSMVSSVGMVRTYIHTHTHTHIHTQTHTRTRTIRRCCIVSSIFVTFAGEICLNSQLFFHTDSDTHINTHTHTHIHTHPHTHAHAHTHTTHSRCIVSSIFLIFAGEIVWLVIFYSYPLEDDIHIL